MEKHRAGLWLVRRLDDAVNFAVTLLLLFLLLFGLYSLWDSHLVVQAASAARYQVYKPTVQQDAPGFAQLRQKNPDVFAWLTIDGTGIDYPVVRGADNEYYLNRDAERNYSLAGALFLDSANNLNFTDYASVIYGHHMDAQAMFGELSKFADRSFFDAHPRGALYYNGGDHGLEFFAFLKVDAYRTNVYDVPVAEPARQAYLDQVMAQALITRDIGVSAGDTLVALSTCSSDTTNGRDILVGRVTAAAPQAVPTPAPAPEQESAAAPAVQAQSAPWYERIPVWFWWVLLWLLVLLEVWLLCLIFRRRKTP